MSERYQSKYVLPAFQHQTGSPLILQAGSILFDTQTGKLLAQLKLQNISRRTIKAAFLSLLCYDTLLNRVGEPLKQQYLDLSAGPGQSFGDRVPLFLPDASVRSIDVSLTGVLFSDESVWKSADEGVFAPIQRDERQTLSASLIAQLNRDGADQKASTIKYSVAPQWTSNLWQCACSQWNLTGRVCVQCNTSCDWLRGAAKPEGLQKRLEEHESRLAEERAQQEQRREQERLEKEQLVRQTAAKRKKTLSIVISLVLVFAAATYYITQMYIPGKNYEKATDLLTSKQYDQASEAFKALGDYLDSAVMAQQSVYQKGTDLLSNKQYDQAAAVFEALGSYSDSASMVKESVYQKALFLQAQSQLDEAIRLFEGLGSYSNASSIVRQAQADKLFAGGDYAGAYLIYNTLNETYRTHDAEYEDMYLTAGQALTQGNYDEAERVFASLGAYRDAAVRVAQAQADKLYTAGDYVGAYAVYRTLESGYQTNEAEYEAMYAAAESALEVEAFSIAIEGYEAITNYRDSADKLAQARYLYAAALLDSGDEAGAEAMYALIPEYGDVPGRLHTLRLKIADSALEAKEYERALELYLKLPQTDELKSREYALAQTCYKVGAYGVATQAYEILGQYELSLSRLPVARYAYASQLFDQGQFVAAAEQFSLLGEMTDSAVRAKESTYQHGLQLLERDAYDEAKGIFSSLRGYQDAGTQAQEAEYRKAAAMKAAGDFVGAGELFKSLGSYKDSSNQEQDCRYRLAEAALAAGDYQVAEKLYSALGSYSDSAEKTKLCVYQQAEILMIAGSYAAAEKLYAQISGYQDSAEKAKGCRLEQGRAIYATGDWRGALRFLDDLGYGDSAVLVAECHDALGEALLKAGRTDEAAGEYAMAAVLPKAQEMLYSLGKDYAAVNQTEKAIQVLWAAGDHAASQTLLMEISGLIEQREKTELALIAYLSANQTSNTGENAAKLINKVTHEGMRNALAGFNLLPTETLFTDEIWYRYAGVLTSAEENTRAYEVYLSLPNYKDTASLIAGNAGLSSVAAAAAAAMLERKWSVGNTVTYGAYEQDNNTANDKEAIWWRVLAREGKKALLISVDNLDCQPYNKYYGSVTWEACTLRSWLNGAFLNDAFTRAQQGALLTTTVKNEDNPKYGTDGGRNTSDKVFLLSIAEAEKLFRSDEDREAKDTAYAKAQGAYFGGFWLRSSGHDQYTVAIVEYDGSVHQWGYFADKYFAVRPALWLDLTSDIVTSEAP